MGKLKEPNSMDECVYFTNRSADNGRIRAWAFRPLCEKCKKGLMGKPVEKGVIKRRAPEYVCNSCGHTVGKEELESQLLLNIDYKCSFCGFESQTTTPYQRKKFQGVDSYIFECEKCRQKIAITKKMKAPKAKKGKKAPAQDDDDF
ncbi:MAG: hypothetical protein V1659_04720 [Candidatus Woesearchaeota archaeon]